MEILVSIEGREELKLLWETDSQPQLFAVGSLDFLKAVQAWRAHLNGEPASWPLPEGNTVAAILLREVILKARGEWKPPFDEVELCHCRAVPLKNVEDAIRSGAHTSQVVSRWTSASTACGTCRPDVEALLEYFLKKTA